MRTPKCTWLLAVAELVEAGVERDVALRVGRRLDRELLGVQDVAQAHEVRPALQEKSQ
jgi:hypothetical protein